MISLNYITMRSLDQIRQKYSDSIILENQRRKLLCIKSTNFVPPPPEGQLIYNIKVVPMIRCSAVFSLITSEMFKITN